MCAALSLSGGLSVGRRRWPNGKQRGLARVRCVQPTDWTAPARQPWAQRPDQTRSGRPSMRSMADGGVGTGQRFPLDAANSASLLSRAKPPTDLSVRKQWGQPAPHTAPQRSQDPPSSWLHPPPRGMRNPEPAAANGRSQIERRQPIIRPLPPRLPWRPLLPWSSSSRALAASGPSPRRPADWRAHNPRWLGPFDDQGARCATIRGD